MDDRAQLVILFEMIGMLETALRPLHLTEDQITVFAGSMVDVAKHGRIHSIPTPS